MMTDLAVLPVGDRYEDVYGGYLAQFRQLALSPQPVTNCPLSWVPLLRHFGCRIDSTRQVWETCYVIAGVDLDIVANNRHLTEVFCSLRPETVDALWKFDAQWVKEVPTVACIKPFQEEGCDISRKEFHHGLLRNEFPVTCNGSFWRPEIMNYLRILQEYMGGSEGNTDIKPGLVLMPCAADKPYPAPIHAKVIAALTASGFRDQYGIANATGVLGVVPEQFWQSMPYYDSGVPNEWRLMQIFREFLTKVKQVSHYVVMADFYGMAILEAIRPFITSDYQRGTHVQGSMDARTAGWLGMFTVRTIVCEIEDKLTTRRVYFDFIVPPATMADYVDLFPYVETAVHAINSLSIFRDSVPSHEIQKVLNPEYPQPISK